MKGVVLITSEVQFIIDTLREVKRSEGDELPHEELDQIIELLEGATDHPVNMEELDVS